MAVLLKNISTLLTLQGAAAKAGRRVTEEDLSIQTNASVFLDKDRIVWVGPTKKLPKEYAKKKSVKEYDCKGRTVLPGFVEAHTHLIFEGDRAAEFEMRQRGVSYQEIAAKGGGILSTMKKTRAASLQQLVKSGQKRADQFVAQGVTTLEIKSGYSLNLKDEMKMLEAANKIQGPRTVTTFLGAHALPPEFKTYEDYLDFLATEVLPRVQKKKLAQRVDVFIEKGFFPTQASEVYLRHAQSLGFDVVVHADQLSLSGGSDVAVKLGALSGDHLLQISEKEIKSLANSEVTCVLLPASDLYMKTKYPAARELIDAGARVAVATDFNPGSSPTQDLNFVGLLARIEMKMTLPEVISAYTVGAAHALNLANEVGSIEVGKSADLISIEQDWQTLFYSVGARLEPLVFSRGKKLLGPSK
ncbi:imidazolonepropionase [Bdellovibrio bacteriovorus]|uniref:Imidazolonepropionase n=1 Tax=Bdellovibrio bacteriovorus TaxID=959 RepID=A0A150WME2_BDEBC|nr:imidazolonepropionase [Bdellovibrio bacteriovorus]KYG65632.1 imidazolonepropionase [Bdellovibrio bacteriovorus]